MQAKAPMRGLVVCRCGELFTRPPWLPPHVPATRCPACQERACTERPEMDVEAALDAITREALHAIAERGVERIEHPALTGVERVRVRGPVKRRARG